jgi:aspartate racemase
MEYRTREMKVIGLLGGMSWESSIEYERIINEEVRRRLGGVHSRGTSHSFL